MSIADNGQYKELQYDVHQLGREMVVGNRLPSEESIKHIVNDAEKQIEQLIYEFVYDLASSATDSERGKEFLYYCEILSRDHKFMRAVKEIYETKHKVLNVGTNYLENIMLKGSNDSQVPVIPFLLQDTRFMNHLENIHHNFESGYQYLTQLRRNLR